MSSVNPWKLEIKDSCLSISVRTPNTRALVDPISSERFSSNSLKTSLKNFKNSDCMWNQFHGKNYVKNRSYIYTTYLNFSLIIEQFPSLVNLISWVIEERLSLDLDWVLTFWSSSMMSWICLRTISSPISIYILESNINMILILLFIVLINKNTLQLVSKIMLASKLLIKTHYIAKS